MTEAKPVLWHIGVSHYSEKVRWALDWKGVEHERREPPPGLHMVLALWWSRGETKTFPVLELDGERILDSTAIIGALEARWPEPPLYPEDSDRSPPGPGPRGLLRRGARPRGSPVRMAPPPA